MLGCTIDTIDVSIVSMPELRVCVHQKQTIPLTSCQYSVKVLHRGYHSHSRPIFTFYLVHTHVVQA